MKMENKDKVELTKSIATAIASTLIPDGVSFLGAQVYRVPSALEIAVRSANTVAAIEVELEARGWL